MPMISIIVPVYNSEKSLQRCIDSILSQTFTNFELLLVNDGSTDSSPLICTEYAKLDKRVRVLNKENGGVSSARNMGLDNAFGEWVTFVDSDDWLDEQFLSQLEYNNPFVDLVISYANYIGKHGVMEAKEYNSRCVCTHEIDQLFLEYDLAWQTSPWAKFYRIEKCKGLRFTEGMHIGEDLVFLYSYIMECDNIRILPNKFYNYDISHENTLTKRIGLLDVELFAHDTIYGILEDFMIYYNIVNENVLKKINWIKAYYVHRVLNSLYHTPNLSKNQRIKIVESVDIDIYLTHTKFSSMKERILRFLLQRKKYQIYDVLRKLISILK